MYEINLSANKLNLFGKMWLLHYHSNCLLTVFVWRWDGDDDDDFNATNVNSQQCNKQKNCNH